MKLVPIEKDGKLYCPYCTLSTVHSNVMYGRTNSNHHDPDCEWRKNRYNKMREIYMDDTPLECFDASKKAKDFQGNTVQYGSIVKVGLYLWFVIECESENRVRVRYFSENHIVPSYGERRMYSSDVIKLILL